jgi:hypothetical protein
MTDSGRGHFERREIVADFFAEAEELRAEFEARVGPARAAERTRFVWDYWHIADQYAYLRTAPRSFFVAARYARLLTALRRWGNEHLGCAQISEPWLSYYIDGCGQELHTDVVQGPFAFVYSLTRWEHRTFHGGETLLMRAEVLDFWRHHDPARSRERDELVERVPARFNQLLVFDARLPHGAATVRGTLDPLASRVAVHGWFMPPRLITTGALRMSAVEAAVKASQDGWRTSLPPDAGITGTLVIRTEVDPGGRIEATELVVSTLVSATQAGGAVEKAQTAAVKALTELSLPRSDGASTITVPFTAEVR